MGPVALIEEVILAPIHRTCGGAVAGAQATVVDDPVPSVGAAIESRTRLRPSGMPNNKAPELTEMARLSRSPEPVCPHKPPSAGLRPTRGCRCSNLTADGVELCCQLSTRGHRPHALDTITYSSGARSGWRGGLRPNGILGAGLLDNRNVGALEVIPKGVGAAIPPISKTRHLYSGAWMNWNQGRGT